MTQIEQILAEIDRRIDALKEVNSPREIAVREELNDLHSYIVNKAIKTYKIGDTIRYKCGDNEFVRTITDVEHSDNGVIYKFVDGYIQTTDGACIELANDQVLANTAKSSKDLQEPVNRKSNPLFDECVANVPEWVMKETSDKMDAMIAEADLEKFRTEYVDKEINRIYPDLSPHLPRKSKLSLNVFNGGDLEIAIDNAVRWQKEQMTKDAIPFYQILKEVPTIERDSTMVIIIKE